MSGKINNRIIKQRLKKIAVFVTDFDGVHTDGYVYIDALGIESVRVSRKDGLAFNMLKKNNIEALVISKEKSAVVAKRCSKLGIKYYQNVSSAEDKAVLLKEIANERKVGPENILYMGDDINDFAAMGYAGFSVAVADAIPEIKKIATYITKKNGGEGAIREVVEIILKAIGKSNQLF